MRIQWSCYLQRKCNILHNIVYNNLIDKIDDIAKKWWQCESMGAVEKKLKEMDISYVRSMVDEGGIHVDQLFFHDPDGFMVEICDCDNLPVIPIAGEKARTCSRVNLQIMQHQQQIRVVQQQ